MPFSPSIVLRTMMMARTRKLLEFDRNGFLSVISKEDFFIAAIKKVDGFILGSTRFEDFVSCVSVNVWCGAGKNKSEKNN